MGKKRILSIMCKWMILILILAVFWVAGKQKKKVEELNFFQVGKEMIKDSVTKQILYSQSMILGLLVEQELPLWNQKPVVKADGFFPYEEREALISLNEEMQEKFQKENENAVIGTKEEFMLDGSWNFEKATAKQKEISMENYTNMEDLVKAFYTVDPTTAVDETILDVEALSSYDCSIDKQKAGPQILLYHTHSQEAFINSEPGKEEDTILGAGDILAGLLEEYGFEVLHHRGKYDVKSRDYAYSNSLPEIEKILDENPQIQVVIDLHRDAVAETTKLVTDIQGRQVAKVMFFNGLGRTKDKGEISYLKNPYLQENLAFSFQMKVACDEYYPGFARSIYLRAYRYNMHLCPKTLLIELGAQTNTKEEIRDALAPLAHVLSMVLSEEEATG